MREKMLPENHVENEDVIGLTLQLQKFKVGTPANVRHVDGNTVLGHYDHLLINPVKRWLHFSPRMDWIQSQSSNSFGNRSYLFSHYPIKLLFPSQEIISKQPCFAYEEWKEPEILLKDNPCLTVVLLNLTDAYRRQEGAQLLPKFLQLLRDNYQDQLEKMRCCVLPSLGYSNFCILMASHGWEVALKLLDHLHGLTVADVAHKDHRVVVLSTDYMLPVCHRSGNDAFTNYFDKLQLMVRVNLCPGVTAQHLANHLPNVQVFRTSGGTDCLLSAKEEGPSELMNFLLDDDNGGFVVDIVSTPQLLMTMDNSDLPTQAGSLEQLNIVDFENAIRAYSQQIVNYNRHNRQVNSLWELSYMVKSICSQPHTDDLRQIMQNLMDSFSYCLNRCAAEMSGESDIDEMEKSVSEFSCVVSNFLSDLTRSDCFFMEREGYNHASVSSTTSLLIAYNRWLNNFTRMVSEVTDSQNDSKYTFLVTCGGRDQTQTMEAFYFLDPEIKKNGKLYEKVPLVTQMSEMSLFDFSGTILRATHECMHFSGVRRRTERVKYLLAFVIRSLSEILTNSLLPESVCHHATDTLQSLNAPDEVINKAKNAYRFWWEKLASEIEKALDGLINTPDIKQWDEFHCLSRNVQTWLYDRLIWAFSGQVLHASTNGNDHFQMNKFAAALYRLTQATQKSYYEECDQLCRKHSLPCVVFSYGAKKQTVFKRTASLDKTLDKAIQLTLSRLLIIEPAKSMFSATGEPEYEKWEFDFPYFPLIKCNINDVLTASVDIFKEAFADVMACEILGAEFEDYVLMHVFEDWDLDSALSVDMANIYRIPAVLHLCYEHLLENCERLTTQARKCITDAIQCLEQHGMPSNRLNAEKLCNRLDCLLGEFNTHKEISAPLLDYLKRCKSDYEKKEVKVALQPFSDSYKAIRLLAIKQDEPDCYEKLLLMYEALINRGGRLP